VPLLGADPTVATRRTILGAPLFTSSTVAAGTVWGIPVDRAMVVMRDDVRLEVGRDDYFSSDRVAVKATMRGGFAFPDSAARGQGRPDRVAVQASVNVTPAATMAAGRGIDGR
jgi:HK97 family phage major capsid protein